MFLALTLNRCTYYTWFGPHGNLYWDCVLFNEVYTNDNFVMSLSPGLLIRFLMFLGLVVLLYTLFRYCSQCEPTDCDECATGLGDCEVSPTSPIPQVDNDNDNDNDNDQPDPPSGHHQRDSPKGKQQPYP